MKPGRNDPCRCGSGRKYKKCCAAADDAKEPVPGAAATTAAAPTAAEDAEPDAKAKQKPPLGSWMHQTRGGKQQTRRSQVGKDSLG
ncbi:MAG: hypothetical protein FJ293_11765 [Planctomycetes bacterium]|nr:hypothetical protein [Planctomycetota bacterium]